MSSDGVPRSMALYSEWLRFRASDDSALGWAVTGVYCVLCILCWRETLRHKNMRRDAESVLKPPGLSSGLLQTAVAIAGAVATIGMAMRNASPRVPFVEHLVVFGSLGLIGAVLLILAWREVFREKTQQSGIGHGLGRKQWIWISTCVTAVAINKQLDAQTTIIGLGKRLARFEGLYHYKTQFQIALTVAGALTAIAIGLICWKTARRANSSERLVIFALVSLMGFLLMRVAMISHVNVLGRYLMTQLPIRDFELSFSVFLCFAVWRNGYR